jgi:hypothetical protein
MKRFRQKPLAFSSIAEETHSSTRFGVLSCSRRFGDDEAVRPGERAMIRERHPVRSSQSWTSSTL